MLHKNGRDEAESDYAKEKEQTNLLLTCNYNDNKAFWKQIKPKAKKTEPCYVPLDEVKDHFAQLQGVPKKKTF